LSGELAADPRIAATRQLGELMKTLAMQQPKRHRWWTYAVGFALAFSIGGALAWFTLIKQSPLADAVDIEQPIAVASTPARQYLTACRLGTEEAWKSVIKNFPKDPLYTSLAREQLVLLYLDKKDTEHALEISNELIAMRDWPEYEAFGWAGRCVAYAYERDTEKEEQALNKLDPLSANLRNPLMKQLVEIVKANNRPQLDNLKTGLDGTSGNN
jgi:hypothetical protein